MIIKDQVLKVQAQEIQFQVVSNQHALLMPIGDVHFGAENFPTRKFVDHLSWGLDRGAVFIGMGEYLDFAPHSQRRITSQLRDEIQREIDDMVRKKMYELYALMAHTGGRWLGMLEGDHRWDFADGTSADQYLCHLLGTDFLGTSALVKVHPVGLPKGHPEGDTKIFAHHGIGTSRSAGGHLNRVEDLLKWVDADIYLMGHSHAKVAAPIDWQTVSGDGVHYHKTKLVARTGSWMKGYQSSQALPNHSPVTNSRGSYIEQSAYTPSALGGLCIGIGFEKIQDSKFYKPAVHLSL
jgi:hypothetical protein